MNQNLLIIFVTFIATIITFFVSGQVTNLAVRDIALVVTSFISVSAIALGFIAFYRTEKNQKIINENIRVLEEIKTSYEHLISHGKLDWLINDEQLLKIEELKEKSKEIWIVSPNPSDDTGSSKWAEVIRKNIDDGISYFYISPKTVALEGAIKGLKTVFRKNLSMCNIVKLTPTEYEKLPHQHLVIYDPDNNHGESDCFAEIDIEEKGWWIKIPENRRNIIMGKLFPMVKKASKLGDN